MSTTSTTPSPEDVGIVDTGRLDGASRLRIFSVLAVIVLFTEVAPLQYIMIAAALQKLTSTFASVGANLTWAIIIPGLVGAAVSPLIGKMSDVWGKKRVLLTCGVAFAAGCLIDALTRSWVLFLIGRGFQALAVTVLIIAYGLIRDLMPRKYVPLALGIATGGAGFSGVIAPIVGGFLVDHYGWPAMFWFLGIYVLVMTPVVMFVVPESKLRVKERINPAGAVLLCAGTLLTLLYLDKGQGWGWGRPTALAWLLTGLALLVLFFLIESRASSPLMDMKLFRHPRVSLVLLMGLFGSAIFAVQAYALGYMTQSPSASQLTGAITQGVVSRIRQQTGAVVPASAVHVTLNPGYSYGNGFSLLQYAVHLGIWAGAISVVFAPLAGALARRRGPRTPAIFAFALTTALGVVYALAIPSYNWVFFLVLTLVFGIGYAFGGTALPTFIVEGVPAEQQGISIGMLGVVLGMAGAIGLAIVTALLNANPVKAHINVLGHSTTQVIPQVFANRGYVAGFWVLAGMTLVALVIAVVMRHGRTPATGGALPGTVTEQLDASPASQS